MGSETREDIGAGIAFGSDGVFANAFTKILPWVAERGLAELYDDSSPWYLQSSQVAKATVSIFNCPSNVGKSNPHEELLIRRNAPFLRSEIGGQFGLVDYIFSKGASDCFCDRPEDVPDSERGMFDYNLQTKAKHVKDGLSKTFAIGEGAGGARWPLCDAPGCQEVNPGHSIWSSGQPYFARQFWIGSGNLSAIYDGFGGFMMTGHLGCTVEPLNKLPVKHFLFDNNRSSYSELMEG